MNKEDCYKETPYGNPDKEIINMEYRDCEKTLTCKWTDKAPPGETSGSTFTKTCPGKKNWLEWQYFQSYKFENTCDGCVETGYIKKPVGASWWEPERDNGCAHDPTMCNCPKGSYSV